MYEWMLRALNVGGALVDWRSTFTLAAMRSAAAGVTWAFLQILGGNPEGFFTFLFLGPIIGIVVLIPLALVVMAFSRVIPFVGLIGFIPLIYMVSGDPILWLVEHFRPGTVPIANFKPFNFKTILIVVDEGLVDDMRSEAISTARNVGAEAMNRLRNQGGRTDSPPSDGSRVDLTKRN
ncbi:hypothetical protein GCM10011349_42020 [Novosphingobium indicum]|uniref:Uncharacterized protein n=2 Tax=Novosphingobium indicum TaxID=462949 RepID=A0ABQ2JZ07_9SPHN|nr:hypothetical protein GCM10011349_42020 [Novosphingobium indicum]